MVCLTDSEQTKVTEGWRRVHYSRNAIDGRRVVKVWCDAALSAMRPGLANLEFAELGEHTGRVRRLRYERRSTSRNGRRAKVRESKICDFSMTKVMDGKLKAAGN